MKKLRCLLADDEPIARQVLENYIENLPNLELVASCKNAFEVLGILENEKIDLLFLDINMPKLSGISLLKTLQYKPAVIITTAYSEYALEGFELSVTDYLLKPFSLERFIQAVKKVKLDQPITQNTEEKSDDKTLDYIFVKSDKKRIKLFFKDINHIEAYGNYLKIYTTTRIMTMQTLSDFLTKLPTNFIRTHKSYIINFDQIKQLDGNQIELLNGTKISIGKSYRKEMFKLFDKRKP